MNQLDDILYHLSRAELDRDLTGLEARIWRRIEAMQEGRNMAWLRALPVTATASALALGFATAMLSAPPRHAAELLPIGWTVSDGF